MAANCRMNPHHQRAAVPHLWLKLDGELLAFLSQLIGGCAGIGPSWQGGGGEHWLGCELLLGVGGAP